MDSHNGLQIIINLFELDLFELTYELGVDVALLRHIYSQEFYSQEHAVAEVIPNHLHQNQHLHLRLTILSYILKRHQFVLSVRRGDSPSSHPTASPGNIKTSRSKGIYHLMCIRLFSKPLQEGERVSLDIRMPEANLFAHWCIYYDNLDLICRVTVEAEI